MREKRCKINFFFLADDKSLSFEKWARRFEGREKKLQFSSRSININFRSLAIKKVKKKKSRLCKRKMRTIKTVGKKLECL
jgi:hypothetical protein